MPEISVIIPVYNVEKYLHKCIDSVLAQTFTNFSILIINDGATDTSPHICEEYAEKYPEKIAVIHQENAGLSSARNKGLACSTGRYILFVDSDDSIQPDMLEQLYETAKCFDFPDMVFCGARLINENDLHLGFYTNEVPERKLLHPFEDKMLLLTQNAAWCRIVKRELYVDNDLWFPLGLWYEDLCMTSELLANCKTVVYIEVPLYNYLIRQGSIMNNINLDKAMDILRILGITLEYFKAKGLYEHYYHELESMATKHLLYITSMRVLRIDRTHPLLRQARLFMEKNFPQYMKNGYTARWPLRKRIVVYLLSKQQYGPLVFLLNLIK